MSAGYLLGALLPALAALAGRGRANSAAAPDALVKNLGFTIALSMIPHTLWNTAIEIPAATSAPTMFASLMFRK